MVPRLLTAGAVVIALALAGGAAVRTSVTPDEFGYLPHGLAWLHGVGDQVADGNPPLFKMLCALATIPADPVFDPEWAADGDFWAMGRRFMYANASRYHELYLLARVVPLMFLALTCFLTYVVAARMYGNPAGVLAAALTCFSPTMLAHGSLVTPDIFVTAATVACLYAANRFVESPSVVRAGLVGLCVGAACLFKLSGALIGFLLASGSMLLVGLRHANGSDRRLSARRVWAYRLVALVAVWVTLNMGYAWRDTFRPVAGTHSAWAPLAAVRTVVPRLPIPIPTAYVDSVGFQLSEGGYTAYLDGQFSTKGFYTYYLRALLYKTPLPVLVLVFAASLVGRPRREEAVLLILALGLLGLFSILRFKNVGVRYVLALLPLGHIWVTRLVPVLKRRFQGRPVTAIVLASVVLSAAASEALSWPNNLSYFNAIWGGRGGGPRHLLDSNIDWGQDLPALREYMREKKIDTMRLAYFGRVDPAVYGIRYRALDDSEGPDEYVAVSVNLLHGRLYYVNGGVKWPADGVAFTRWRAQRPVARIGDSICVFRRNGR